MEVKSRVQWVLLYYIILNLDENTLTAEGEREDHWFLLQQGGLNGGLMHQSRTCR